ncbi:MAG TPA: chitobiase/beta-hexosaminidase C-terminal domain-containing protein [Spirochaetota bacterium]|nr:chitobiase/beta-hexosaminidase C-terminal domain-containing protein [Spirochaetota bacterium]
MSRKNLVCLASVLLLIFQLSTFLATSGCIYVDRDEYIYVQREKADAPTFSPLSGEFTEDQKVEMYYTPKDSSSSSSYKIAYTKDGTNPVVENGVIKNGYLYTGSFMVSSFTVLKAVAFNETFTSDIGRAAFSFKVSSPLFTPATGKYGLDQIVSITNSTNFSKIYYTTDGSSPSSSSSLYVTPLTISKPVTIKAIAYHYGWSYSEEITANFSFQPDSPHFYPTGGVYDSTFDIIISPKIVGSGVYFTNDDSTPDATKTKFTAPVPITSSKTIKTVAIREGMETSNVNIANYVLKTAAPVIEPAGGTYGASQTITIFCKTSDAEIRYTTDGTDPTADSALYTGAITVDTTDTQIKAIALKSGFENSNIVSQKYFIVDGTIAPPAPEFSEPSGTYENSIEIEFLNDYANEGYYIRYSIDGTAPTNETGKIYEGDSMIYVDKTTTIKAVSYRDGMIQSEVKTATFTITGTVAEPTLFIQPEESEFDEYQSAITIDIACDTTYSVIRYTTDGTEPDASSYIVDGLISISGSSGAVDLRVKAFRKGWTPSETIERNITFKLPDPVFNPEGGSEISKSVLLTISQPVLGAKTYYTINGDDPKISGALYESPILINSTTTVKAYSKLAGWTDSETVENVYTFTTPLP